MLDILDYSELFDDNGFMLFLDFYKVFDNAEHQFILQCLHKFGFGSYFCSSIETLYRNGNGSVNLIGETCPRSVKMH